MNDKSCNGERACHDLATDTIVGVNSCNGFAACECCSGLIPDNTPSMECSCSMRTKIAKIGYAIEKRPWLQVIMMAVQVLVILGCPYYFIIVMLEDPNEKRRKERAALQKARKKIETLEQQKESSSETRPVVVLNQRRTPKAKKKHHKEGKRRKTQLKLTVDEEKRQKHLWMKGIHRVHLEAASKFRKIRQELDAMNLERVEPKQKQRKTKADHHPTDLIPLSSSSFDSIGKKAGKSQYIVLVGAPENLYKTRNIKRSLPQILSIDLHGMSKSEAISKLDNNLPLWFDTAMRGSYPFVVPVKIICGKGSQTLSEAVAEWIRKKKEVSNAPKDLV